MVWLSLGLWPGKILNPTKPFDTTPASCLSCVHNEENMEDYVSSHFVAADQDRTQIWFLSKSAQEECLIANMGNDYGIKWITINLAKFQIKQSLPRKLTCMLKSVKCYCGEWTNDLVPQQWNCCVQYTICHHMSPVSASRGLFQSSLIIWIWY